MRVEVCLCEVQLGETLSTGVFFSIVLDNALIFQLTKMVLIIAYNLNNFETIIWFRRHEVFNDLHVHTTTLHSHTNHVMPLL